MTPTELAFTWSMSDVWSVANPVIGELLPIAAAVVGIGLAIMTVRFVKGLF